MSGTLQPDERQLREAAPGVMLSAPGYDALAAVFRDAFNQAAHGKGKERHANGEPFTEQVMQTGAHRFGTGALLFQAFKKSEESQRLPHDRAVAELLGAMVYLAGAVINMQRIEAAKPANDNAPCAATVDGVCAHTAAPCTRGCSYRGPRA